MKHFTRNFKAEMAAIWDGPAAPVTYDTPHTVVLTVNDWLGIQSQLGFAAVVNDEQGDHATAIVQRGLLAKLREQTRKAIDAAAEEECRS